jgi:cytochrome c
LRYVALAGAALFAVALAPHLRASQTVDATAAERIVKENNCFKCHAVDRKKDGPAYRDVAAKFRDVGDAESKLIFHMTSGEKVKFPDGHEERHKKVKVDDQAQLKNLAAWILSLEGGTKY